LNKEEIEKIIDDKIGGMRVSLLCVTAYLTGVYPDFLDTVARMLKKIESDFGGEETKH